MSSHKDGTNTSSLAGERKIEGIGTFSWDGDLLL